MVHDADYFHTIVHDAVVNRMYAADTAPIPRQNVINGGVSVGVFSQNGKLPN